MCIVANATVNLSNTVIYAAEVLKGGKPVHVLGYQNQISGEKLSTGPNAMLLPIPAAEDMGPENLLNTRSLGLQDTLKEYRIAVRRLKPNLRRSVTLGLTKGASADGRSDAIVFNSGPYTVILSKSAAGLKTSLNKVPENKRPDLSTSFVGRLSQLYPKWHFALCCFNDADMIGGSPDPVFWWYIPKDPEILFAPAIDAHDGLPPRNGKVDRDHTVVFGSYQAVGKRAERTLAVHIEKIPFEARWFFTDAIVGSEVIERQTNNGDFVLPISRIIKTDKPGYIGADEVPVMVPATL